MSPTERVATAVTALFVPGDRPDRFRKAVDSGADVVIIDLEDAVAPADKAAARETVVDALRALAGVRALVRINDLGSPEGSADLESLAALVGRGGSGLLGIVVPKAADPALLAGAIAQLSGAGGEGTGEAVAVTAPGPLAVVALIESAAGVTAALGIAALPGLTRLAFGALDFAADVGADVDTLTGQFARAQVVIASRTAGLSAPLESPATELTDPAAVEASSRAARALGFGGRLCIHPAQLAPVRAGFAPTVDEISWARRILTAGDSVSRVDDHMVDRPILERARSILRRVDPV